MSTIARTMTLAAFLGLPFIATAASLQEAKTIELAAAVGLRLEGPVSRVEIAVGRPVGGRPPSPSEARVHGRTGYTFESEATSAREEAEKGLRANRFPIVSGEVYQDGFKWAYRLNYLAIPGAALETYSGTPVHTYESEAKAEMRRTKDNLKSLGHGIIVGQAFQQGFKWTYQIDYVKRLGQAPALSKAYGRAGYTYQSDANSAREEAEKSLRAQGFPITSGDIYQDGFKWGFRVNYAPVHGLTIETLAGGAAFTFESDASSEMKHTIANLRSQGRGIVLGQTFQRDFKWSYQIDYVKHAAPRNFLMKSGVYSSEHLARRQMDARLLELRGRGCIIRKSTVFKQERSGYTFEIQYTEP